MGTPVPLYNTGYGWMWSDGVIRTTDSYDELQPLITGVAGVKHTAHKK